MATHYTCDRCGVDINEHGHQRIREIEIDWPPPHGRRGRAVVELMFDVRHPQPPSSDSIMRPDLCDDCYAHILHEVASMLDTDREPEPAVQA
jgi:hypothetical protein